MNFKACFCEQVKLHPSILPQDAIKHCFQAAFGAEHLLADVAAARDYFDTEMEAVESGENPLFERLSPDFCRVNFAVWKNKALPAEWLFEMFRMTAAEKEEDGEETFAACMRAVGELTEENLAPFAHEAWREALENYERGGIRPVHHSEAYRKNERPSYRVVAARFVSLLPVLEKMAAGTQIVAIDGRAASGKTTLAELISSVTGAGVIHMDDFFLPEELRTVERLASPGGNVHYERILKEVIPNLAAEKSFSYQIFDCEKMQINGLRRVAASQWKIVEGSYSHHPEFKNHMNLRIFCDIQVAEQMKRICRRDGDEAAAMFETRWIPMEEQYFKTFRTKESADIVISAG